MSDNGPIIIWLSKCVKENSLCPFFSLPSFPSLREFEISIIEIQTNVRGRLPICANFFYTMPTLYKYIKN